jgi:hypothetical protein
MRPARTEAHGYPRFGGTVIARLTMAELAKVITQPAYPKGTLPDPVNHFGDDAMYMAFVGTGDAFNRQVREALGQIQPRRIATFVYDDPERELRIMKPDGQPDYEAAKEARVTSLLMEIAENNLTNRRMTREDALADSKTYVRPGEVRFDKIV